MAKMTLLEMAQDILSDMNSDEVNSITDSLEATQVANIIRSTYYNIIDGRDYPWLKELFQLDTNGTSARPTHMLLPTTVIDLEWIKYNRKRSTDTKDRYMKVTYRTPDEFMNILNLRSSSATNVQTVSDPSGIKLHILTDVSPTYFTSFDDETLVFDSYDTNVETTLMSSKTQCFGKRSVTFVLSDNFVPDLPVQMFSYLLNEAKSNCFLTLKQMPNQKAEQNSISQKRRMSQEAWRIKNGITYPNYGRKSK